MFVLKDTKVELVHVALSPDGARLAAFGLRGPLQLWDLAGRRLDWKAPSESIFRAAFFTPDSARLFVLEDESGLCLFDCDGGERLATPAIGLESYSAAGTADGRQVCLCHSAFQPEGYVLVSHRLPGGEVEWTAELPDLIGEAALTFSLDGRSLAFGTQSGSVHFFDAATGAARGRTGEGGPAVRSVALTPDGGAVAWCAGSKLFVRRLDRPDAVTETHNLGRKHFFAVAAHPSGDFFASVNGDGKVDTWDARTGNHREALDWGVGKLNAIAFDAAGDRAACCGKSGQIVVWDVDR